MTKSDFVHYIWIRKREVRDHIFRDEKPFQHGFVYEPAAWFEVCANGIQTSGFNSGFNVGIDPVKINQRFLFADGSSFSKWHCNETHRTERCALDSRFFHCLNLSSTRGSVQSKLESTKRARVKFCQ